MAKTHNGQFKILNINIHIKVYKVFLKSGRI